MNNIKKKIAAAVLGKKKHEIPELSKFRLGVCNNCPNFDKVELSCNICGCFMDVKVDYETSYNPKKLRNEITHCPNGFWGDSVLSELYNF